LDDFYFQNDGISQDGVFKILYAFLQALILKLYTIKFVISEYGLLNIYKQIMEAKFQKKNKMANKFKMACGTTIVACSITFAV
jgi:hypothetical protein